MEGYEAKTTGGEGARGWAGGRGGTGWAGSLGGREVGSGDEEAGVHGVCVVVVIKGMVLDSKETDFEE